MPPSMVMSSRFRRGSASSPTVFNRAFIGNFSDCHGGGVASINGSSQVVCKPAFVQCVFEGNETLCDGGGFYTDGGNCVFLYCEFKANRAVSGGGLHDLAGIPVLYDYGFECNEATQGGAFILVRAPSPTSPVAPSGSIRP